MKAIVCDHCDDRIVPGTNFHHVVTNDGNKEMASFDYHISCTLDEYVHPKELGKLNKIWLYQA